MKNKHELCMCPRLGYDPLGALPTCPQHKYESEFEEITFRDRKYIFAQGLTFDKFKENLEAQAISSERQSLLKEIEEIKYIEPQAKSNQGWNSALEKVADIIKSRSKE